MVAEKYQIQQVIGAGGMATVYKARHVHFRELRALKVINTDLASDESFVRRFVQEAVVTRRLQHPNIVRIDDIERAEDGRPFIVMELVEGTLLKDALKNGLLPLETALSILRQVAYALESAHALGMVHRDIKPGNIMIENGLSEPTVKVLDFGIARIRESQFEDTRIAHMTLTGTGAVVGTPAYMSPEQAMGKRGSQIDGRADLYSLGTMAYQMLTGRPPFSADSDLELMLAHMKATPEPIKNLRPDLPEPLCDAIMSCLAKDPGSRPATCAEFIAALDNSPPTPKPLEPPTQPPKSKPRISYKLVALLTSLCIVISALIAALSQHKVQPSPKLMAQQAPVQQKSDAKSIAAPPVPPHSAVAPPQTQNHTNASVSVDTGIAGAVVLLDGKVVARTNASGHAEFPAPAGSHQIKVSKDGFQQNETQHIFSANAAQHLSMKLTATKNIAPVQPPEVVLSSPPPSTPLPTVAKAPEISFSPPVTAPVEFDTNPPKPPGTASKDPAHPIRKFGAGLQVKLLGVILAREGATIKIRIDDDSLGSLLVTDETKILLKSGVVFHHTNKMDLAALVPGLRVEAQGVGNENGVLTAERIAFDPNSMRASRPIGVSSSESADPLLGVWVYQPDKPEKLRQGIFQPEKIILTLKLNGGVLGGHYSARYKVPEGNLVSPEVDFDLVSTDATKRKFKWTSREGDQGVLDVRPIEGNAVRLSWKVTSRAGTGRRLSSGVATLIRTAAPPLQP